MSSAGVPKDCLTEDEIIQFFNEVFTIGLSKQQLANPSPEIVAQLYEMMLVELGVSRVTEPDLTATQDIDHIERYAEFIKLANIRLCVEEVLRKTGFQAEFTFLDLVQPKKKKVLHVLSRLIHLWTQVQDLQAQWEERAATLEAKQKEKEKVHSRLQALHKTLQSRAVVAAQCRASKPQLEERLKSASEKYDKLKNFGNSQHETYRAEKMEFVRRKEQLSELEVKLQKLYEENAELEALIVRSPNKVKAETAAMEQRVANLMSQRRLLQQEYVESVNQADAVMQAQKDLKPAMETLRETFADLEVLREKCAVAEELKEQILTLTQKLKELRVIEEQLRENVSAVQNQVKKNRIQFESQLKPLMKMNEDVKEAIHRKQDACDSSTASHKQLLQEEMSLTQKLDDVVSERQLSEQQFADCVAKVLKAVQTAIDTKSIITSP
jgi:chromosome segregation ATPase